MRADAAKGPPSSGRDTSGGRRRGWALAGTGRFGTWTGLLALSAGAAFLTSCAPAASPPRPLATVRSVAAPPPSVASSVYRLAPPAGPLSRAVYSLPVRRREVFITIDDGWYPSRRVLGLMRRRHLPLTAFLLERAMQEHPRYWKAFVVAGGNIQDHTVTHPVLTRLPYSQILAQVKGQAAAIRTLTGRRPLLLRPPYGAYDAAVLRASYAAGIPYVVLWTASVPPGPHGYRGERLGIATRDGKPLRPGEIILMHWDPGLYGALRYLLSVLHRDGLTVGNLPDHFTR